MAERLIALGIVLFLIGNARASERVCLKSGFCLEADSHEQDGQNLALRIASGTVEVPAYDVASIEAIAGPATHPPRPTQMASQQGWFDPQAALSRAADAEGIDRDFLQSVAKIESDFNQQARSNKGAIGLMQLMPGTAAKLSVDATEASGNALGGAKYLRELLVRYRFNSALALAAYNAGPGAVQRYGGVPPYTETRAYIAKVTREYDKRKAAQAKTEQKKLQPPPDHALRVQTQTTALSPSS